MSSENPTAPKVALAPDLRRLSDRAARAWAERMAVRPLGDGEYAVDSESGATYAVDALAGTCTCPDRRIRGKRCKHLRRVAIEITTGRVSPPDCTADCAACGADVLPAEDGADPPLCAGCRVDAGDVVLDRETGDRLVVVRVTDERASGVEVPEARTTVAEYPANDGYPSDDPVVEAVYVTDLTRRDDPRRYSFPLSRLRPADDAALVD